MNPRQSIALYLFVFEGHSHDEIANEMGISVSVSKELVHRAREYLAKHGIDEETFFSMPPLEVEIRQEQRERSVFWRKHYDWFFRVGNAVSLLVALGKADDSAVRVVPFSFGFFPLTAVAANHQKEQRHDRHLYVIHRDPSQLS